MEPLSVLDFESHLKKKYTDLCVKFKEESYLSKALGRILHSFNPDFMSRYTTTLGSKVYFPKRSSYESEAISSAITLAHETIHINDYLGSRVKFVLSYLFPQVLVVPSLMGYLFMGGLPALLCLVGIVVGLVLFLTKPNPLTVGLSISCTVGLAGFSVMFAGFLPTLLLAVGIISLCPLPAPFRAHWELRGYTMSMAMHYWLTGRIPDSYVGFIKKQFTGSSYYYMDRNGSKMDVKLLDSRTRIYNGSILEEEPYRYVYDYLNSKGLVVK